MAELLRVDPGTAAAALRALRQEGLVGLEREKGTAGRFGLSVYVLRPIAGLYVLVPGGHGPAMGPADVRTPVMAPPRAEFPCADQADAAVPTTVVPEVGSGIFSVSADVAGRARAGRPLTNQCTVGRARLAGPRPAGAGLGRPRMTAARVASPEGWQVSVRCSLFGCSLFGVDQGAVVNGGSREGPALEVESEGARALGAFLGGDWRSLLGSC